MSKVDPGTPTFYVYILVIIGLVLFAGLMSGLTLGLMSLGLVDLEVLIKSGQPADRKHAGNYLSLSLSQSISVSPALVCRFLDFCLSVL
jgi:metal transporter CNNM